MRVPRLERDRDDPFSEKNLNPTESGGLFERQAEIGCCYWSPDRVVAEGYAIAGSANARRCPYANHRFPCRSDRMEQNLDTLVVLASFV